jgi:DNA-binding NtrC family response regulator
MEEIRQFRIFLVDDDLFNLTLMSGHLSRLGYTALTTMLNGTECVNRLTEKPEVVFLDHAMEGLNGFEVLKKIKRFDPNIYVVMVSGQDSMKMAVDSLKYGAFDYIIKNTDALQHVTDVMSRITAVQEVVDRTNAPMWKKLLSRI